MWQVWLKRVAIAVVAGLLVFVVGFVPYWLAGLATTRRFQFPDKENANLTPASFQLAFEEIAFRGLRRSPLDYLEIGDITDAMVAVDRLLGDADLYRAMVEQGRRRAVDYRPEAIVEFWVDLLWRRVPAILAQRPSGACRAWEKALQFVGLEP